MKKKIKKLRKSDAGEINLKKTDSFKNAKFVFSLHVTFFQHFFAFRSRETQVYQSVELSYVEGLSR